MDGVNKNSCVEEQETPEQPDQSAAHRSAKRDRVRRRRSCETEEQTADRSWSQRRLYIITFRVDGAKCIVATRVCVSVSLSFRGRMPTLSHGPGCI